MGGRLSRTYSVHPQRDMAHPSLLVVVPADGEREDDVTATAFVAVGMACAELGIPPEDFHRTHQLVDLTDTKKIGTCRATS